MSQVKANGAADFYRDLSLDLLPTLPAAEAKGIKAALSTLTAEAPLTLEIVDRLGLSREARANLLFLWLARKYPDDVTPQLRGSTSLHGLMKKLAAPDEDGDLSSFLADFHTELTARPAQGWLTDQDIFHGHPDQIRLRGEVQGRLVFEVVNDGERSVVNAERGADGRFVLSAGDIKLSVELVCAEDLEVFATCLKATRNSPTSSALAKQFAANVAELLKHRPAPRNPSLDRLETELRLALADDRVGKADLDDINAFVEAALQPLWNQGAR